MSRAIPKTGTHWVDGRVIFDCTESSSPESDHSLNFASESETDLGGVRKPMKSDLRTGRLVGRQLILPQDEALVIKFVNGGANWTEPRRFLAAIAGR